VGELRNKKNQNTQVALRYERGNVASNHTVRLAFQLPHDKEKSKYEVQKYIGSSSEELFKTLREMNNLVKNNDLLPENFPTTGTAKKRASALILPRLVKPAAVDTRETPQQQAAAQSKIDEYDRYKFREKMNRLEVFRGYEKIFGTQETKDTFMDSVNEAMDQHDVDHATDPNPPEFYTSDELKKHIAKVAKAVLPNDAVRKQTRYLQRETKPQSMGAKQWVRRVYEINNLLPLFPDNKNKFDMKQINEDCIIENLPQKTLIEFRRNPEYRQIINKDKDNQPSVQEIIDVLEEIEENEVQIKPYKIREPNGTRQKNMCNKPGHNHEWRYCPDNPYGKKEPTNETSMRCEEVNKEKDNDDNTPISSNFSIIEQQSYWLE